MIIVGISGAIGSGKSTLAALLTQFDAAHSVHLETSTVIIELAKTFNAALTPQPDQIAATNTAITALLPQLSAIAGRRISLDQVVVRREDSLAAPLWYAKLFDYLQLVSREPALLRTPLASENKSDYRALLQWLGGYFLYKLDDPLLWYKELKRQIDAGGSDIAFVALTAPRQPAEAAYVQSIGGKVILIKRPKLNADRTDATERRVNDIVPDITVINDGSPDDLQACAAALRTDLERNRVRARYRASQFAPSGKP
jgi:hypothetical protein